MEIRADSSPPARSPRGRALAARLSPQLITYLALWVTLLLLFGCGSALRGSDSSSSSLVVGARAVPIPPAQLALAIRSARRFAYAYAASIYLLDPGRLPAASATVDRALAYAATRVPAPRRERRPRAIGVRVAPSSTGRLDASVVIADGVSAPITIAFVLRRFGSRWLVVSVSAPE